MYLKYDSKEENTTMGMPKPRTIAAGKTRSVIPVERGAKYFDSDVPVNPDEHDRSRSPNIDDDDDDDDDKDCEPLADDVYAFIVAAPVFSTPFLFASYVIMVKYTVYGILAYGILDDEVEPSKLLVKIVKFFLIPVAIAMQEDLIHTYASVANITYNKDVLNISSSATKCKLILSFVMRFFDGILSLGVNFAVMMEAEEVLNVFLNFAALHFLQSIDDVFFQLVEKGFFGDKMEHMSNLCKQITFPRRTSERGYVKSLDSILLLITLSVLLVIYGVLLAQRNRHEVESLALTLTL